MGSPTEDRVLDAVKCCCERWGAAKVTVDDIAGEAKVSRATLYRMFPGGKDVLFDALRVRELGEFFGRLEAAIDGVDNLTDLLVAAVVHSIRDLRHDEHLALMMASSPGETVASLTVDGLPRILRFASLFLTPLVQPYLSRETAAEVVEVLVRLVISDHLSPSELYDLGDPATARRFITTYVLSSHLPIPSSTPR